MRNPVEVSNIEDAPAVLRWAAQVAATCRSCGDVHEYRQSDRPAVVPGSWAHPADGHAYRRTKPQEFTDWLTVLAEDIEARRENTGA